MRDRVTYAGLWMLDGILCLGWVLVVPLTTPLGWVIYWGLHSSYRDYRLAFRAAMKRGDVDAVDLFLHRQTPLRPRLARYSNGSDDDGARDLGYVPHRRDLSAARYPDRMECPTCGAQYEKLPAYACAFCGTDARQFFRVERLASRVP